MSRRTVLYVKKIRQAQKPGQDGKPTRSVSDAAATIARGMGKKGQARVMRAASKA